MNMLESIGKIFFITLMFWNLENYFDPFEGTTGNEYTPLGEKHWTWKKFCKKRDLISKIIIATHDSNGVFPSLIGVCEVENIFVLKQLTSATALNSLGYKILHRNSIDKRGIDVALLYRASEVAILEEDYFPKSEILIAKNIRTRYVLYTKCVIKEAKDTLHIFVNHWPSKIGGEKLSLEPRLFVAKEVMQRCDSILYFNPKSKIILMGDFNDTPNSLPIKYLCGDGKLINLAQTQSTHKWGTGSYKFRDKWEAIDQIIVSDSTNMRMSVFAHSALLQDDKSFLGKQIVRTSKGPRYMGGASDHLPILLQIKYLLPQLENNR